jgi:hypothetical protein
MPVNGRRDSPTGVIHALISAVNRKQAGKEKKLTGW